MSLFFYSDRGTLMHRLHPVVKLVMLAALFTAALLLRTSGQMAEMCGLILVLFALSRSLDGLWRMSGLFGFVCVMTFILWSLFYEGGTARVAAWLPITREALGYASFMSLRFLALLLAGLLYLCTASIEDFSDGLVLLGMPYSVAFALSLSFRLVSLFAGTGFTIAEAQSVRGNDAARGNIFRRLAAYVPLMVPLIINGIKKAETLTLALESKGFSPGNKIDIRGKHAFRPNDAAALIVMAAMVALAIAARIAV